MWQQCFKDTAKSKKGIKATKKNDSARGLTKQKKDTCSIVVHPHVDFRQKDMQLCNTQVSNSTVNSHQFHCLILTCCQIFHLQFSLIITQGIWWPSCIGFFTAIQKYPGLVKFVSYVYIHWVQQLQSIHSSRICR